LRKRFEKKGRVSRGRLSQRAPVFHGVKSSVERAEICPVRHGLGPAGPSRQRRRCIPLHLYSLLLGRNLPLKWYFAARKSCYDYSYRLESRVGRGERSSKPEPASQSWNSFTILNARRQREFTQTCPLIARRRRIRVQLQSEAFASRVCKSSPRISVAAAVSYHGAVIGARRRRRNGKVRIDARTSRA
jgi:hypothetical protein